MKRRTRNPFPGVTRVEDRHKRVRWRFRRGGVDTYLPGAYGSAEFRAAHEAAVKGAKAPAGSPAPHGTVSWLIAQYLGSLRFKNLSRTRMRQTMHELDWLRDVAGKYPYARMGVQHVEAVMKRKVGPGRAEPRAA